jgi:hypothetical protein
LQSMVAVLVKPHHPLLLDLLEQSLVQVFYNLKSKQVEEDCIMAFVQIGLLIDLRFFLVGRIGHLGLLMAELEEMGDQVLSDKARVESLRRTLGENALTEC